MLVMKVSTPTAGLLLTIPASFTMMALIIVPRMRRLSQVRNYISAVDFVWDRYRNRPLRVMTAFLMTMANLLFMCAQLVALGSVVQGFTDGQVSASAARWFLGGLVLIFELFGGLRAVAGTDAIQGLVMLTGFIFLGPTMAKAYGSYQSTLDTLRTTNETNPNIDGLYTSPNAFFEVPTWQTAIAMVDFILLWLHGPLYPHIFQRVYAAEKGEDVKLSLILAYGFNFFFMT